MKIGIIGCGSIGLLFASYLSIYHDVTVYTRRKTQADEIIANGITLVRDNQKVTKYVNVRHISEGFLEQEFVIVTVKQYDLSSIFEIEGFQAIPSLLFLQNGMSHVDKLEQILNQHICLGVVEHGALKQNDSTVVHTGIGVTKISIYRGDINLCKMAFRQMIPHFSVQFEKDWYQMLISKLVINAVINPLTALFRVSNGDLILNSQFSFLSRQLFDEITVALHVQDKELMWESLQRVCQNTTQNRSSMLKDIEAGRKTEVDSILGYIITHTEKSSIPLTTFVYHAIKGIEWIEEEIS